MSDVHPAPGRDVAADGRAEAGQDAASGPASRATARLGGRGLVAVVLVAALVGAGVSAAVSAAWEHDNPGAVTTLTIRQGTAAPGAARLGPDVTIPQLIHRVLPAVVSIDVKSGGEEDEGTGMIISPNGTVVTNNHVVSLVTADGGTMTVTESGTTKARPAVLVGTDPSHDLALLRIEGASGLPTVTFGPSSQIQVGDAVVAIGNALGLAAGTPTVTSGIVSATGRTVQASNAVTGATENLTNMIQTDAAINPGNSGGPLIDSSAQVIGMNTAVAGTDSSGTNAQNIGFAIPASTIETLLPKLEKGGTTASGNGYLGVDITTLTPSLRQQYGFTPTQGAVILDVVSGSPADQAGLSQGDVIVAIDGHAITSADQVQTVVGSDHPGQQVHITYYVGNERRTVTVTLGSQAQQPQQTVPFPGFSTGTFGTFG